MISASAALQRSRRRLSSNSRALSIAMPAVAASAATSSSSSPVNGPSASRHSMIRVAKAYAELTSEGWLESHQGLGLFVATPRQRLSDAERERRMDDAVQAFVHEVIALDYPPDRALARLDEELRVIAPKKKSA